MKTWAIVAGVMGVAAMGEAAQVRLQNAWEKIPVATNAVAERMARFNIDAAGRQAIVESDWDETAVVDTAIRLKRFEVFYWVSITKLTPENRGKVKAALLKYRGADGGYSEELAALSRYFPPADRADFYEGLRDVFARRYPDAPVYASVLAKYYAWHNSLGNSGTADEALRVLLAPEWPLEFGGGGASLNRYKERIKALAIVAARKKMRAEGKSFVTKDGVNPLAEALKPVTDALNAPACEGVEAALRGVGIEIDDVDRRPLMDWETEWGKVLDGTYTGWEHSGYFPKVAVILGVEAFNKFVDEYNSGLK